MSSEPKAKVDPLDLIRGAKRAEKSVPICMRGDLVAEIDKLESQLAWWRPSERLVGDPEKTKLAQRIEDLRGQMRDTTVTFTLRALTRREFKEFVDQHQPREGDAQDTALGINRETYAFDLVKACLVDPELDDETYATLVDDTLSAAQWQQLADTATELNIQDVKVPFSSNASLILRNSEEKSRQQPSEESPSNGSTGGSRRKSRSTPTTSTGS